MLKNRNKNGLMNHMMSKGLVFGVLVVLFVAIVASLSPVGAATAKEIGSSFIVNDFDVKVRNVKVIDYVAIEYSGGYYLFEHIPGRKFAIVNITTINIGKTEHYAPSIYASITASKGYHFGEWSAPVGVHSEEYHPRKATKDEIEKYGCYYKSGRLYPGEMASDDAVFEIPEDTEPLWVNITVQRVQAIVDLVNPKLRLEPAIDIKEAKIQKGYRHYVVNMTYQNIGGLELVGGKAIVYLDEKEVNYEEIYSLVPLESEIKELTIIEKEELPEGEHEVKINFLDKRGNEIGEKILKFEKIEEIPGFEIVLALAGLLAVAYLLRRR